MADIETRVRVWWQPPRRLSERPSGRRVSFLELFYDLVYVVLVAEVGHRLAHHMGVASVGEYLLLFSLVWLAWINGAMYHDLHGNNDIRTRAFTFLQMGTVAAMAVFAHDALGASATGFAVAYAAYQLILAVLWWRTGVHDPRHRPLAQPYALALLVSVGLFAGSAAVPDTARLWMWCAGLALSILAPVISVAIRPAGPDVQAELDRVSEVSESAVERFGLFTIIVLGEVIAAGIRGIAAQPHPGWQVFANGGLGMVAAISLWWLYFDFISHRPPAARPATTLSWMYLHLFMTMGIVAASAATDHLVANTEHGVDAAACWTLAGSIALVLCCIAALMKTLQLPEPLRWLYGRGGRIVLGTAVAVLAAAAVLESAGLAAMPLLAAVNALLLLPVVYGIRVWIRAFAGRELPA